VYLKIIAVIFAIIGVLDRLFGNKLGLSAYFEKGLKLIGATGLAMVGMIVIAPVLADLIRPLLSANGLIDPSVFPAILFANDMGAATLSTELANDSEIGMFNAMVVSSMMGCSISYTIPVALGIADKKMHRVMSLGIMCGIVTIPIGCIVGGILAGLNIGIVLIDLLPIVLLAAIIVVMLIAWPAASIKAFNVLGFIINALITAGLILGFLDFLLGYRPIENIGSYDEAFDIVVYACTVLSGALPFLALLAKLLRKPFSFLGGKLGINEYSAVGFIGTLATNVTTFESLERMDKKGAMLNSAFAVSAAFVLGGHMAFTMAFCERYVVPVMLGKFVAGITAVILCAALYPRLKNLIGKQEA